MNEYYVYGLIDPRTNLIFYIGKGKGKRAFQHVKEKHRFQSNTEKLKIISDIHNEGLEITYIIISENLGESSAHLLEKILIFRIGRKIFDEGNLSNLVPGGKWTKEDSYFVKEEHLPSFEIIQNEFPELVKPLTDYPRISLDFKGFESPDNPNDNNVYFYDISEKSFHEYDIDSLIKYFTFGNAFEIINGLKNTIEPVLCFRRIWSKTKFNDVEDISRIPFQEFDIIDFEFVKQVNNSLSQNQDVFLIGLYKNGNTRTELKITSVASNYHLTYYFQNGIKKHVTTYLNGKLNGKCSSWYPNEKLQYEIEYLNGEKKVEMHFCTSGKIKKSVTFNEKNNKVTKEWYENGQIKYDKDGNGSSSVYSEHGILLRETKEYYVGALENKEIRGYDKIYYDTGQLNIHTDFTNGHENETIKKYKRNGEILSS